jgi:pimeloyl-ACP methyl ester carboxylesterase
MPMALQDFTTGNVTANGVTFHYVSKGEGPLILCMHGFPDVATTFEHQLNAFSAAGYRVVAPYMRGYSPTEIPSNGSFQTAAFGQDVLGIIDQLGYDSAILIGHDWGVTAVTAAAVFEPARVSKLITSAVTYGSGMAEALLMDWQQQKRSWYMFFFQLPLAEMAVPLDNFTFIDNLWKDWSPGWDYPQESIRAVKDSLASPGVLQAALEYYRCALNPEKADPALADLQARLGEPISVPTLHIHGEQDGCIGANLTRGMETSFTNGLQIEIISGAGHFVHQENPEEFNRLVMEFIA